MNINQKNCYHIVSHLPHANVFAVEAKYQLKFGIVDGDDDRLIAG